MGVCESYTEPKKKKKSDKGHQLYYAPITPYKPIFKPGQINSISYVGYNYVQRSGSIMSQKDYEKTKKKVDDFYKHYLYLIKEINSSNIIDIIQDIENILFLYKECLILIADSVTKLLKKIMDLFHLIMKILLIKKMKKKCLKK